MGGLSSQKPERWCGLDGARLTYTPGMEQSRRRRSARITLVVVLSALSFLAVVSASATFFAWVLESNGQGSSRQSVAETTAGAGAPAPPPVAPLPGITTSTTPTSVRTTSPTLAPLPATAPAAGATEVLRTAQAPGPARVPAPSVRQCPSGAVTSTLTAVNIAVEKSSASPNRATVLARGTVTNGTSAPVGFLEFDIPNFQGLNVRGQPVVIELHGTYDWAPPPGVPSGGEIHLQPGQSVSWSAVSETWDTTVHDVTHWYSAAEPGSMLTFFGGSNVACQVGAMVPGTGAAILNTVRSTG